VFPQQGSFVAPIRVQKVIEGSFVRESLETAMLDLAAACWSPVHDAAADAILARQRTFAAAGDHQAFFREDQNFHRHFAAVAGINGVTHIIDDAATHVVRVRRLATPVAGHMERAIDEHQRVLDHLRTGNTAKAVATLRMHLSRVYSTLARLAERYPDYFDGGNAAIQQLPEALRHHLETAAQT